MRVLGAARLSKGTPRSDSIPAQRDKITAWARVGEHSLVHVTEDVDMSGAIPPEDRPGLGPWLRPGKVEMWDALVVTVVDRFARDTLEFLAFRDRWCVANGKQLVAVAEDASGMMGGMRALFAEEERRKIRERRRNRAERSRLAGEWDGRAIPPGYKPVEAGSRWVLVLDEAEAPYVFMEGKATRMHTPAPVIRRMAEAVIAGSSIRAAALAEGMNHRTARAALRNESIRGMVMHDGKPVRAEDGSLARREPVLGEEAWEKLQAALDRQGRERQHTTGRAALLLRVLHCGECGQRLYIFRKAGRPPVYRHRDTGRPRECPLYAVPAADMHGWVEARVLEELGDLPVAVREETPAVSHAAAIQRLEREMAELDQARREGDVTAASWGRMAGKIEADLERLRAIPEKPAGIGWRPTAETHRQVWKRSSEPERNRYLQEQEVTVRAWKDAAGELRHEIRFGLYERYMAECRA